MIGVGWTTRAAGGGEPRLPLDALMLRLREPGFVARHRRAPSMLERSGHVSAALLAVAPPRSRYVRDWRMHARRCPDCADAFRYFGISLK